MLMRLVDPLAVLISAGKEDSKRFPVRGRMSYYDWPAAEWQQLPRRRHDGPIFDFFQPTPDKE